MIGKLTREQLLKKAEDMQKFLDERFHSEDIPAVLIRCEHLNVLLSQSGKCLADATYYKDEIMNGAIMESIEKAYDDKLSPSTINKYVESCCKDYNYLIKWFDRINSTAGKQLMNLNTIISFQKAML